MALGGKRIGAGRKKGYRAIKAEEARKFLIDKIAKDLDPIVTAQIEAAKGMYVQTDEGKIYQKQPDLKAGEYLLNQGVGKPTETIKVEEDVTLKIDL